MEVKREVVARSALGKGERGEVGLKTKVDPRGAVRLRELVWTGAGPSALPLGLVRP